MISARLELQGKCYRSTEREGNFEREVLERLHARCEIWDGKMDGVPLGTYESKALRPVCNS